MAVDYYLLLGVDRTATPKEIRDRFRSLARERHPDRFPDEEKAQAEEDFQAISEAFNVLMNPERRRQHDIDLSQGETPAAQESEEDRVARVYMQRGVKAYKDRNYLDAAENFSRATKTQPDNAKAWYHLALACTHQRRWLSRGMSAISKACELDEMNATYLKLAGKLFAMGGMTLRAEQYYNRALEWGGEDPAVRSALEEIQRAIKKGKGGLFGRSG